MVLVSVALIRMIRTIGASARVGAEEMQGQIPKHEAQRQRNSTVNLAKAASASSVFCLCIAASLYHWSCAYSIGFDHCPMFEVVVSI